MSRCKIMVFLTVCAFLLLSFGQTPANAFWTQKNGVFLTDRHSNSFLVNDVDKDNDTKQDTTFPENNNATTDENTDSDNSSNENVTNDNSNSQSEIPTINLRDRYFSRFDRERTYFPVTSPQTEDSNEEITTTPDESTPPEKSYEQPEIPEGLTADEAKVFKMINEFRIENGVAPVSINMKLVELARKKAQDMVVNDYFGHTSPTYGSAKDMVTAAGIKAGLVGENLSKARDAVTAQIQLEYSTKGHREIMLREQYSQVGVGIAKLKNVPGIVLVEIFIEPR